MYSLFIDTCLNSVIVSLYKNGKLDDQEVVFGQKYNSQFIMPTVKKVVDDIKLDEIIVVNGPGSFTGVRLGVTVAKTLAYTLNIPIYTITSLEVMAISTDVNPKVVAVKDNNDYYVGIFDNNNVLVGEYKYLDKKQFEEFNSKYNVVTETNTNYEAVYKYIKDHKDSINPHMVKPLYIKKISVQK